MNYTACVITVSDKGSQGLREDTSGPALVKRLEESGYTVVETAIIPDEFAAIAEKLIHCADELDAVLVLTTGGTGLSPRDVTPEATLSILEREARGIPEAMRYASLQITSRACLSRGVAGTRKSTLIINLPGSKKAAVENLDAVLPALGHGLDVLRGNSGDCGVEGHHHHHH